MSRIKRHDYRDREALATALAAGIAAVLAGGIATRGAATLAVSGGSTPKLFLQHLSRARIDWPNVTVILVDERVVAPDSERSNARLVRENLLNNEAAAARFVPFETMGVSLAENEKLSRTAFAGLADHLDAAVLGMGADGHAASFFPGAGQLSEALSPTARERLLATEPGGGNEARLTLTLRYLLDARFLALHIEGEEKRTVLQNALAGDDIPAMPVRAVLQQDDTEVNIFWAP